VYRVEHKITRHELTERTFKCARCGARADVMFHAIGESGWQREGGLLAPDPGPQLAEAAEVDLRGDAQRLLALLPCPTCGKRAPRAMFWAGVRVGFWIALGLLVPILGGAELYLGTVICWALGGAQAWRERGRLVRARKAVITKLTPGVLPQGPARAKPARVEPARAKPALPEARAIVAPPIAPPAPREPGDEPTFLRER